MNKNLLLLCVPLERSEKGMEFFMEDITKSDVLQVIGKNIKRIRLLRGLSQETLASDLQKSINFVSLVERGESGLSVSTIVDICRVLKVDANCIFEGVIASPTASSEDFITNSLALFNKTDKAIVADLITYIVNSKT